MSKKGGQKGNQNAAKSPEERRVQKQFSLSPVTLAQLDELLTVLPTDVTGKPMTQSALVATAVALLHEQHIPSRFGGGDFGDALERGPRTGG